jgi:ABC-type transport system substrate-binding protein
MHRSTATVEATSNIVADNIFQGLYEHDEHFWLQPWLAESVDRPDGLTYVFQFLLRPAAA